MIPLQSACPIAFRCRQEIHEVASCFPVLLVLERHVEVGGGPEHMKERPQSKALSIAVTRYLKRQICALLSDVEPPILGR